MVAKLGRIEGAGISSSTARFAAAEAPGTFDLEFRNEVTELVHEILQRSYVTHRTTVQDEAQRWGLSLEQMVAAAVSHHVMKKVDMEYV